MSRDRPSNTDTTARGLAVTDTDVKTKEYQDPEFRLLSIDFDTGGYYRRSVKAAADRKKAGEKDAMKRFLDRMMQEIQKYDDKMTEPLAYSSLNDVLIRLPATHRYPIDVDESGAYYDYYAKILGSETLDRILGTANAIQEFFHLDGTDCLAMTKVLVASACIRHLVGIPALPELLWSDFDLHFRLTEELVELKDAYKRHSVCNLNTLAEVVDVNYFILALSNRLNLERVDNALFARWFTLLTRIALDDAMFANYAAIASIKWRLSSGIA